MTGLAILALALLAVVALLLLPLVFGLLAACFELAWRLAPLLIVLWLFLRCAS